MIGERIELQSSDRQCFERGLTFIVTKTMLNGKSPLCNTDIGLQSILENSFNNAIESGLNGKKAMKATFKRNPIIRSLFSEQDIEETIEISISG